MQEVTWDNIEPLIASMEQAGPTSIFVVFQCPLSGGEARATGHVDPELLNRVSRSVKRSLLGNLRFSLSRVMYSVFGHGLGGVAASAVTDAAASTVDMRQERLNQDEMRSGAIDAFYSVKDRFIWDKRQERFVFAQNYGDLQPEFLSKVQQNPITKPWDRAVLARMLTQIAAADGTLEPEERDFFETFLAADPRLPSLNALLSRPPLTRADLEEVTPGLKPTMWLIAVAMAHVDGHVDESEDALLDGFADAMGLSASARLDLRICAREYILDQSLDAAYADGHISKDERHRFTQLAAQFGIPQERLERLEVRCQKRHGVY